MKQADDNATERADDDDMIDRPVVCHIMGDISTSTCYEDPEIRALAIPMNAPGKRTKIVRWLRREILELRRQRIARARENSEMVRAKVVARTERRRARRRIETSPS